MQWPILLTTYDNKLRHQCYNLGNFLVSLGVLIYDRRLFIRLSSGCTQEWTEAKALASFCRAISAVVDTSASSVTTTISVRLVTSLERPRPTTRAHIPCNAYWPGKNPMEPDASVMNNLFWNDQWVERIFNHGFFGHLKPVLERLGDGQMQVRLAKQFT